MSKFDRVALTVTPIGADMADMEFDLSKPLLEQESDGVFNRASYVELKVFERFGDKEYASAGAFVFHGRALCESFGVPDTMTPLTYAELNFMESSLMDAVVDLNDEYTLDEEDFSRLTSKTVAIVNGWYSSVPGEFKEEIQWLKDNIETAIKVAFPGVVFSEIYVIDELKEG